MPKPTKESCYTLLQELYYEYKSVIDSAYCQCDWNESLLKRVENRLGLSGEESL